MIFAYSLIVRLSLFLLFYLGTWPTYLADLLSLRLVGEVGGRINVRSSYPRRGPAGAEILTQGPIVASPALLLTELVSYTQTQFRVPAWHLHTTDTAQSSYSMTPVRVPVGTCIPLTPISYPI